MWGEFLPHVRWVAGPTGCVNVGGHSTYLRQRRQKSQGSIDESPGTADVPWGLATAQSTESL